MTDTKSSFVKSQLNWYLFLIANVLIVVGVAVAWVVTVKKENIDQLWIITTFNCISLVFAGVFFYLETKDIVLYKMHISKKWINMYFLSGFLYGFILLFIFLYQIIGMNLINDKFNKHDISDIINTFYIIEFAICSFLSVLCVAVYKITKYNIDISIEKRKNGELPKQSKKDEYNKKEEDKPVKVKRIASSGLAEYGDKKKKI